MISGQVIICFEVYEADISLTSGAFILVIVVM